jgi:hypothetical protein
MAREFSMTPITYRGHTKPLAQWAQDLEIPYETLRMRMSRGETDPEKLLRKPRNYWRPAGAQSKRFDISVFDDMFPAATVEKLREIARQSGLSTLDVVVKIVTKKVNELVPDSKTN